MKSFVPYIYLFIFLSTALNAFEVPEQVNVSDKSNEISSPRIFKLIPDYWIAFPKIQPEIPEDYIQGKPPKFLNYGDGVLWGRKDDLKMFSQSPGALVENPIFFLSHMADVAQSGPDSFHGEEAFFKKMKKMGLQNANLRKSKWGEYPLRIIDGNYKDGSPAFFALIGLNSAGHVLFATVFPPNSPINVDGKNQTTRIWNNFISKTKQLDELEFFKAAGMDIRDDYTIYKSGTASVKVYAEKRQTDNKLGILVSPLTPNTTFCLSNVDEVCMGSKWKYGEACVKAHGCITEKDGDRINKIDCVITVLTKDVEIFSFDTDKKSHPLNTVIHTQEGRKNEI